MSEIHKSLLPEVKAKIEQARYDSRMTGERVPISFGSPVVMPNQESAQTPESKGLFMVPDPVINAFLKNPSLLDDPINRARAVNYTTSAYRAVLEQGHTPPEDVEKRTEELREVIEKDRDALIARAENFYAVSQHLKNVNSPEPGSTSPVPENVTAEEFLTMNIDELYSPRG